jgi:hypothetical protein
VLICEWDGLGSAGETMPIDFSHVEVHMSTSSGFTPTDATMVDRLHAAGKMPVADLPYGVEHFFRLVAVDRTAPTPNKSAPSGTASATPGQVVSDDVFDGAIGSAKLADLAVTTAKIADLAVNNAKIGDLSVGKLTAGTFSTTMTLSGIIRTASTGARVQIDGAGVRLYNSADQLRVELRTVDGSAMVTGEYRSALSGTRFVINAAGVNPDEMRFYPSSGSQYGKLTTVTSMSEVFGVQTGLTMQAHSGRGDGFSGVVNVFPDYASIAWGETSIQTVPHQIGMGAPRMHFSVFRDSNFDLNGDDEVLRLGVVDRDNVAAGFIAKTLIEYRLNAFDEPSWRNLNLNCGVIFGPDHIGSINGGSSGYIQHRASSFSVQSSARVTKRDIRDLDFEGGPLAAVRRAKIQKWRRIDEVERHGDAAEVHIGPMADDLPAEVVRYDEMTGHNGYALESFVGLVSGGLDQLAGAVAALTARVEALETRNPPRP